MTKEEKLAFKYVRIYTKKLEAELSEAKSIIKTCKDCTKNIHKERKVLIKQLNLAKTTILAFGYAYEYGKESGNFSGPDWDKAIKLYQTCDDEMDMDSED